MDTDREINSLSAETLAIQSVLGEVFYELKLLDPRFADAIARGCDNAASRVENLAIQAGKAASSEYVIEALHVVEELRTASLGHHDKPRHGV